MSNEISNTELLEIDNTATEESLIKSFEEDPIIFIEEFLNRYLSKKQIQFIDFTKTRKHIVAIWSRQSGKSTIIASYLIWRLLYGKGCVTNNEKIPESIAILAPIKDQLTNLYDKMRTLIDRSEFVSSFIIKMNSERIILKNGNRAVFLSASPGSHIRGFTATCIVIDESQDILDHKYNADILPFGATTNALILEAGTPKTKNHFFKTINNPKVAVVRQLWFECPFLSKEYVMMQKANSPLALWRQEFLTEFIEEGVLAFPSALFEDNLKTGQKILADYDFISEPHQLTKAKMDAICKEEGSEYIAGIDLGKERDPTVYSIYRIDTRPVRLVVQIEFKLGTSYIKIAEIVGIYHKIYSPTEFNIDYTNEKSFIEMLLANNVNVINDKKQIRGCLSFTNKLKQEMVNRTTILLENYQLQLPSKADALLQQFMNQQYEISESGNMKYYHPTNEHDDRLWSTLLALKNVKMWSEDDTTEFVNSWEKHDQVVNRPEKVSSILQKAQNIRKQHHWTRAGEKRLSMRGSSLRSSII